MADSGLLIVISGFSGSGKGTIMKELIRRYPENPAIIAPSFHLYSCMQPLLNILNLFPYFFNLCL